MITMFTTSLVDTIYMQCFREMSAMRQPSEWGIGRVKCLFSFLEYKVSNFQWTST